MNVQDFTYLLQHPEKVVSPVQTKQLEDVFEEYPYFQAARAIHLKGLKNLNSFKYNKALKVTAAYTTDRDVLFDFITSKDFLRKDSKEALTLKTEEPRKLIEESEDKPLPQSVKDADQILDPALFKSKRPEIQASVTDVKVDDAEKFELGQPLPFTKNEKHSFVEWLQLTSLKTVDRKPVDSSSDGSNESSEKEDASKRNKFQRIDMFIKNNPKIVPKEKPTSKINIKASVKIDKSELMTETLAKVYLEQKKYKKAIQAYKILSLKYPEKSGFFADRIKAVEKIQKENI